MAHRHEFCGPTQHVSKAFSHTLQLPNYWFIGEIILNNPPINELISSILPSYYKFPAEPLSVITDRLVIPMFCWTDKIENNSSQ